MKLKYQRHQFSKQQGFTLVEIAIVLVIIGLLLGLVLQGQEFIKNARVTSMANQNSQLQAAYFGFVDRYRAIPGDMTGEKACNAIGASQMGLSDCTNSPPGGDGNGKLDQGDIKEAVAVWAHMSAANFIVGSYLGTATTATQYDADDQAPINSFKSARVLLGRTDQYENAAGKTGVKLGFVFGRNTPVDLLSQLDTKIDDGQPSTGVLRSTKASGEDYGTLIERDTACLTTSTSTASASLWNVSSEESDCNAIYLY